MWVTLSSVAATAVFSLALMKPLGFGGLALATSLSFTLSGWVGVKLLSRDLGMPLGIFPLPWVFKMGISLAVTAAAVFMYNWAGPYPAAAETGLRSAWVGGVFLASCAVYGAATAALGFQEWVWLRDALTRRKRRNEL
jgi:putative peptidoglycan lipid II flippase